MKARGRQPRTVGGRGPSCWSEEYAAWFTALIKDDLASATQVAQAVAALREEGPALGRPLVDRIKVGGDKASYTWTTPK
jgi:hypothetical protein